MTVFGVIGGYGATGSVVVSELRKSGDGEVLIGGRDAAKGVRVDVLDARSLDDFCRRCLIVITCAGPVKALRDRVAQAAFRSRCHYVDLAGLALVREAMLPYSPEMAGLGLSCVVSAGWIPGITELLPVYTHTQASAQMDSIDSMHIYFSDSGEWSDNALRDGVWHLHRTGMPKPGHFHKGRWVAAKMSEASGKFDLVEPIGRGRVSLYSMPELDEVAPAEGLRRFHVHVFGRNSQCSGRHGDRLAASVRADGRWFATRRFRPKSPSGSRLRSSSGAGAF
jgi:saccharopine dehydrogenase-like NADP-dependent oxidoreductase